ncbi:hypothetical protein [Streptomyces sp. NL15-2K]|uniref:hypothetical protein n=1 Tax=Streptomyces sp. NL15-2K TaxID=376149 RepID=UPI000F57ABC7|nr:MULTISPECIES: hypothetical protein [Actinomycetes]WKX12008.1 hypothetical protein Q4V64_32635 [Kutzneria buriramensis]GCB46509.1 hypothetical protein SNL152K_3807 [Streptomyces sp. NL15-2K]
MLARLPLGHLLLMAALATFLLGLAIQRWMSPPRAAIVFVVVASLGACLGMTAVGAAEPQWSARQMLVLYSFVWAGMATGLFLSRKGLMAYGDQARRAAPGPPPPFPTRYVVILCGVVSAMALLAFVLAT